MKNEVALTLKSTQWKIYKIYINFIDFAPSQFFNWFWYIESCWFVCVTWAGKGSSQNINLTHFVPNQQFNICFLPKTRTITGWHEIENATLKFIFWCLHKRILYKWTVNNLTSFLTRNFHRNFQTILSNTNTPFERKCSEIRMKLCEHYFVSSMSYCYVQWLQVDQH